MADTTAAKPKNVITNYVFLSSGVLVSLAGIVVMIVSIIVCLDRNIKYVRDTIDFHNQYETGLILCAVVGGIAVLAGIFGGFSYYKENDKCVLLCAVIAVILMVFSVCGIALVFVGSSDEKFEENLQIYYGSVFKIPLKPFKQVQNSPLKMDEQRPKRAVPLYESSTSMPTLECCFNECINPQSRSQRSVKNEQKMKRAIPAPDPTTTITKVPHINQTESSSPMPTDDPGDCVTLVTTSLNGKAALFGGFSSLLVFFEIFFGVSSAILFIKQRRQYAPVSTTAKPEFPI